MAAHGDGDRVLGLRRASGLLVGLGVALLGCDVRARVEASTSAGEAPSALAAATVVPAAAGSTDEPALLPTGAVPSWAPLVERVSPALVHVRATGRRRVGALAEPSGDSGSGFFFDAEGHVLTNHHVVEAGDAFEVERFDGRRLPARVVGTDRLTDLAVLSVASEGHASLEFADSEAARVGDWVLAIGAPFGLSRSASVGILSAKGRGAREVSVDDPRAYFSFLQTDVRLQAGSSGGPLLDLEGRVLGVNTAVGRDGSGLSFAIPANMVRALVPRLLADGKIHRSALGVGVDVVPELPNPPPGRRGAFVASVQRGSPAEKAGLEVGDVVVEFDGRPIGTPEELRFAASLSTAGKEIPLAFYRGKALRRTLVTPRPAP